VLGDAVAGEDAVDAAVTEDWLGGAVDATVDVAESGIDEVAALGDVPVPHPMSMGTIDATSSAVHQPRGMCRPSRSFTRRRFIARSPPLNRAAGRTQIFPRPASWGRIV
jgi:hypothetical protein